MSRSRTRISRALIGLLTVTIVLGVVAYVHQARKSSAAPSTDAPPIATEPVAPASPADTGPRLSGDALVTSTPVLQVGAASQAPAITPRPVAPAAPARTAVDLSAIPDDKLVSEGKARLDAGDLLKGRDILNAALLSGKLGASDQKLARGLIAEANKTIIFSSKRFPDDPWQELYTVKSGDLLVRIANVYFTPYEFICRINDNLNPKRIRPDLRLKVIKGPFHAVVDKSDFTMDLYLGSAGGPDSMYVTTFRVGLGAEDSTPTGDWKVPSGAKMRNPVYYSPRGEGIIAADDPNNPLGDHWIALEGTAGDAVGKQSYGIHGTIEPSSIGTQASMGCIRLLNEDVAQVFEMLYEVKSTVVIQD